MTLLDLLARELPQPWYTEAMSLVTYAAEMFHNTTKRREWTADQLRQHLQVSESTARCLVELAVLGLYHHVDQLGAPPVKADVGVPDDLAVRIGDTMRMSVALMRDIDEQPDHSSQLVSVKNIRSEEDGSKTIVCERLASP